jgi:hypothetical protein
MRLFYFLLIFGCLLTRQAFSADDPELRRIFDDINFMSYQLSLDFKPSTQVALNEILPSGAHKVKKSTGSQGTVPAIQPMVPISRHFAKSTEWADLDVTILDYGTRMTFQVKSSIGAIGWMLQKGNESNVLFNGNVENNALNFQFDVTHQYSDDLGLTVYVNAPDGQNPAFIPLK